MRLGSWGGESYLAKPWPEACIVLFASAFTVACYLLSLGGASITWDLVNHHLYLGRSFGQSRLGFDHFAAASMSCQVPWSYWALASVVDAGGGAFAAGAIQGVAAVGCVLGIWVWLRAAIPGGSIETFAWRLCALCLAFSSALWIAQIDHTSNDLLVCALVVGAVAAFSWYGRWIEPGSTLRATRWSVAVAGTSGFLFGVAVAAKISVLLFAPGFAAAWLYLAFRTSENRARMRAIGGLVIGSAAGLGVFGLPFWWDAWRECGSPIYPIATDFFSAFREMWFRP